MLRNFPAERGQFVDCGVLNEVLSLNAQEYPVRHGFTSIFRVLNEVLSLNAQECHADEQAQPLLESPQ